jgi:FixJ family two-component response regulator
LFLVTAVLGFSGAVIAALLDDDADLLEALADLLQTRNCRSIIARSVDELQAHAREVLEADVAVLDINLGPGLPTGLDAYDWLLAQGFRGRILFLTGHAHAHPLVARAEKLRRAEVLDKPMDGGLLLERILGAEGSALSP